MILDLRFKNTIKGLFFICALVFLAVGCNIQNPSVPLKESNLLPVKEESQKLKSIKEDNLNYINVEQKVSGLEKKSEFLSFRVSEGTKAMVLLKMAHKVETKTFSGIGEYVVSIDGIKENTGKNFWAFYVNAKQAKVGPTDYGLEEGDKIEWKLEDIK